MFDDWSATITLDDLRETAGWAAASSPAISVGTVSDMFSERERAAGIAFGTLLPPSVWCVNVPVVLLSSLYHIPRRVCRPHCGWIHRTKSCSQICLYHHECILWCRCFDRYPVSERNLCSRHSPSNEEEVFRSQQRSAGCRHIHARANPFGTSGCSILAAP